MVDALPRVLLSCNMQSLVPRTTLVLKNLPRHFDKDALKDLLEKLGTMR